MADYHKIVAARQRVQSLFVPHLSIGGDVLDILGGSNDFHADAPSIDKSNFKPGIQHGADIVNSGVNTMQGAAQNVNGVGGQLQGTAGQIGKVAGQIQGVVPGQVQAASDIHGLGQGLTGMDGVLSQQKSLAGTLADQVAGRGPNPAQEQYKQNINQAILQNQGMINSQKGINPALAARMGAQNAASMQQGAAGNAATLQAQQQIAAQSQLGAQQQAMGNTIGQAGNLTMGSSNILGQAGNTLGQAAGVLGQAGNTQAQAGNAFGAAGGIGANIAGAGNTFHGTNVQGQQGQNGLGVQSNLGAQGINAGVAASNTAAAGQVTGGILNAAGGAAAVSAAHPSTTTTDPAAMAHGGTVGVDGKALSLAQTLMAQGGAVPGQPKEPGKDTPANDVQPTVLSPHEIVLPISVSDAPDAPQKAAEFVEQLKAKAHPTYGHVLKARKALEAAEAAHKAQGGMC